MFSLLDWQNRHSLLQLHEQQFLNFFKWLQNEQELKIDTQQVERLQNLVTLYTGLTGYSSLPYRRLLMNIAENQKNKETDVTTN